MEGLRVTIKVPLPEFEADASLGLLFRPGGPAGQQRRRDYSKYNCREFPPMVVCVHGLLRLAGSESSTSKRRVLTRNFFSLLMFIVNGRRARALISGNAALVMHNAVLG
jgi:hypothetical protein